jgi:hypothetical protein
MNDNDTDEIQPGEERTLAGRIRKTNPFKSPDGRFLPGHRKVGGRTPGTKSYSAHVLGAKLGVNPLELGLEMLRSGYVTLPGEPPDKKRLIPVDAYIGLLKDLARYFAPQLSAVAQQISAQVETSQVMDVTQLMASPELARAAQLLALGIAQQPQLPAGDSDDRAGAFLYEDPDPTTRR